MTLCEPTTMCFPVGISDVDRNIENVTVTGGVYNEMTNRVCVDISAAGTYVITVQAEDACEAFDSDQMIIEVTGNNPPSVTVDAPDTVISQCEPVDICLP